MRISFIDENIMIHIEYNVMDNERTMKKQKNKELLEKSLDFEQKRIFEWNVEVKNGFVSSIAS